LHIKFEELYTDANIKVDLIAERILTLGTTPLHTFERQILNKSGDVNDEGTNSMMSDFITEQEKTVWMMMAWLGESI
jgi:starvation-inducible DNA-binding protein